VGPTATLLNWVAGRLQADGVGTLATWRQTDGTRNPVPLILMAAVPAAPDNVVTLTGYSVGDDRTFSDSEVRVQVRTRTGGQDPRSTDNLADAAFSSLHGLSGFDLPGGLRVLDVWRTSSGYLGQDANDRHERSDNYSIRFHNPGPHRL
jgi:hypothetical protein